MCMHRFHLFVLLIVLITLAGFGGSSLFCMAGTENYRINITNENVIRVHLRESEKFKTKAFSETSDRLNTDCQLREIQILSETYQKSTTKARNYIIKNIHKFQIADSCHEFGIRYLLPRLIEINAWLPEEERLYLPSAKSLCEHEVALCSLTYYRMMVRSADGRSMATAILSSWTSSFPRNAIPEYLLACITLADITKRRDAIGDTQLKHEVSNCMSSFSNAEAKELIHLPVTFLEAVKMAPYVFDNKEYAKGEAWSALTTRKILMPCSSAARTKLLASLPSDLSIIVACRLLRMNQRLLDNLPAYYVLHMLGDLESISRLILENDLTENDRKHFIKFRKSIMSFTRKWKLLERQVAGEVRYNDKHELMACREQLSSMLDKLCNFLEARTE